MADTHHLCSFDDLPDCEARRFEIDGRPVAVVRIDGDVYAVGDTCTHADVSLSEGEIDCDDRTLECWKHGSQFSLVDGAPLSLPATRPTPVYEVRVEGTDVVLRLDSEEAEQ